MNAIQTVLCASTTLLLLSCGGDGQSNSEKQYLGYWQADGYNYMLEIARENDIYTYSQYSYTEDYCLLQRVVSGLSFIELKELVNLDHKARTIEAIEPLQSLTPGIFYKKQKDISATCAENIRSISGGSDYQFNAEHDFNFFWQTFDELYINFDNKEVDWVKTKNSYRQRLELVENEEDLASLFADMIAPLEDGHTVIIEGELSTDLDASLRAHIAEQTANVYGDDLKPTYVDLLMTEYVIDNDLELPLSASELEDIVNYANEQLEIYTDNILNFSDSSPKLTGNDHFLWTKFDDNIGYVSIGSMTGYTDASLSLSEDKIAAETQIDSALADLKDTKGIIIDVRLNEGGFDEVSLVYVSRFLDKHTHLYSKRAGLAHKKQPLIHVSLDPGGDVQYTKPVILLTSETTFSGAEVFALAMRERDNTVIVGEPSGGGLSDLLIKRVYSNIAFGLSSEVYLSADGEWFERVGIPVDHLIAMPSKAQRADGEDLAIEFAIDLLSM